MRRLTLLFCSAATITLFAIVSVAHLSARNTVATSASEGTPRTAVLIELFTSEGCSDCPPADALLERLDRSQPVAGADLVVLSEHVDYWNGIGWKDPYSSHQYSERQNAYAGQFGLGSVYTPQMVVDGQYEFVGSDERRAIHAVENVAKVEKIPVHISSLRLDGGNAISLHIDASRLPSSAASSANVLLAIADERDESHVDGGENGGRTLRHVAVLRSLTRVGTVDQSGEFSKDLRINANPGNGDLRFIAIVQEMTAGRILGVGSTRLSK